MAAFIGALSRSVVLAVAVHPLASLTAMEYVPAPSVPMSTELEI